MGSEGRISPPLLDEIFERASRLSADRQRELVDELFVKAAEVQRERTPTKRLLARRALERLERVAQPAKGAPTEEAEAAPEVMGFSDRTPAQGLVPLGAHARRPRAKAPAVPRAPESTRRTSRRTARVEEAATASSASASSSKSSSRTRKTSRRAKTSERSEKKTSQRREKKTSQRAEISRRVETISRRVEKVSERMQQVSSQRAEKASSRSKTSERSSQASGRRRRVRSSREARMEPISELPPLPNLPLALPALQAEDVGFGFDAADEDHLAQLDRLVQATERGWVPQAPRPPRREQDLVCVGSESDDELAIL
ncbi:MAG: hypothetical protein R3F62_14815 [Planctomycetota bacterium]